MSSAILSILNPKSSQSKLARVSMVPHSLSICLTENRVGSKWLYRRGSQAENMLHGDRWDIIRSLPYDKVGDEFAGLCGSDPKLHGCFLSWNAWSKRLNILESETGEREIETVFGKIQRYDPDSWIKKQTLSISIMKKKNEQLQITYSWDAQ